MLLLGGTLSVLVALGPRCGGPGGPDLAEVRGVTISCQTWGREWGTPDFGRELDELSELGANWVAIHPYASIRADGSLRWRPIDEARPPDWLRVPLEEARRRGFGLFIKPHIAYWGSPFSWRGEIHFDEPAARERFWHDYQAWIACLARAAGPVDAFAVGTELDRMLDDEDRWRELIARVRTLTPARLTYAANWTDLERVPFWDALDAVGVQAYFPISDVWDPTDADLLAGWQGVLASLRALHERTGKPVVFTEFGYNRSLAAPSRPWAYEMERGDQRARAEALQARCLRVGLSVLARERSWLCGAFLWKWFVGEPGWHDASFLVDVPYMREVLSGVWGAGR